MKKIVYFITAFTMLYGLDSEARLPKSQGEMAAALLMQKAGLTINIPTDWTQANHDTKVGELMGNNVYKFIIDTIYTTPGRNAFARWMKEAYKNCTNKHEWKDCNNFCYADSYHDFIAAKNLEHTNQKASAIKLANAFFPCWTGTFTAFFISKGSKNCRLKYSKDDSTTAAKAVIGVSGAPSLWVLSAKNTVQQAERYNALLSQCNNLVKKILWVMFVLETVDDPEVVETIVSDDITRQ